MQARYHPESNAQKLRVIAVLAALCGGLVFTPCWAQSDTFDVTVEPTDSASLVTVLGNSTLGSSALLLRSLDRLTDGLYDLRQREEKEDEDEDEEEDSAGLGTPYLLVATGPTSWLAVGAAAGAIGPEDEIGSDFARLSGFSTLDYRFGEFDGDSTTSAYDIDMYSVTVGVDYRLNADLVAGVALNYVSNDNDFTAFAGKSEQSGYSLAGFASWYPWQALYLDTVARVATNDYDIIRQTPTGTALGETDGSEYALSLYSGYQFNSGALAFGPLAGVTYTNIAIDGYTESGAPDALAYKDQDLESVVTALGANGTYAIKTGFGVLVPQASAKWIHEFEDDPRLIVARPAAGGAPFGIPVEGRDSDYCRLAIGGTAILAHGRILFLWYETDLSRGPLHQHTITAGARMEW